jgi:hypothetical protein
MICVSGAFAVWRRDVILEVGGFSSNLEFLKGDKHWHRFVRNAP